jgi:hypothetical protein
MDMHSIFSYVGTEFYILLRWASDFKRSDGLDTKSFPIIVFCVTWEVPSLEEQFLFDFCDNLDEYAATMPTWLTRDAGQPDTSYLQHFFCVRRFSERLRKHGSYARLHNVATFTHCHKPRLAGSLLCPLLHPENLASKFLRNVWRFLPVYTTSHPRSQYFYTKRVFGQIPVSMLQASVPLSQIYFLGEVTERWIYLHVIKFLQYLYLLLI